MPHPPTAAGRWTVLLLTCALVGCPPRGDDDDDAPPESFDTENVGTTDMDGHTPRGFQGQGTGLFAGDNINPNFPDGDGVQIFTTLETPAALLEGSWEIRAATLRIPDYSTNGSPFADLGGLNAEEIRYDAFSSALWDAEVEDNGGDCVLGTADGDELECDVTGAVQNSVDDGYGFVQFRVRFDDAGDSDGSSDLLVLNPSDSNTPEPGLLELAIEAVPLD